MIKLGVSGLFHDSAAALVQDGTVVAAVHEERHSKVKHDSRFPFNAINECLSLSEISLSDIDELVWYEDIDLKLRRTRELISANFPKSRDLFQRLKSVEVRTSDDLKDMLRRQLGYRGKVVFSNHHSSHFMSTLPLFQNTSDRVLGIVLDGVGEYRSCSAWIFKDGQLTETWGLDLPHSLGLVYGAITQIVGFEVNDGEYKTMGLASYGIPRYSDRLLSDVFDISGQDFQVKPGLLNVLSGERQYEDKLLQIFDLPSDFNPQSNNSFEIRANIAASIQDALNQLVLMVTQKLIAEHKPDVVTFSGGVALNCTTMAHVSRNINQRVLIQPAAGDAGASIGAAFLDNRSKIGDRGISFSPYLGGLSGNLLEYESLSRRARQDGFAIADISPHDIANFLAQGKIVGLVQGRAEFGPRALGNRSILASPLTAEMKDVLNSRIKFREEFRPFAPVVLDSEYSNYFEDLGSPSDEHMLFTVKSLMPHKIPAVTHVDGTSRVQRLKHGVNPLLQEILEEFRQSTGVPVLALTSFNLKGEPMVQSVIDAYKTFVRCGIDILVTEDFSITKFH
jgi:carbamoyltransferase